MTEEGLPSAEQIITIHDEIEKEYDLKYTGVRVAAPRLQLQKDVIDRVTELEGTFLRAAGLLRHTISAHVFEDGNKRTAWTVTVLYLQRHDAQPAVRGLDAEPVLRRIRAYSVEEIAKWLATGEIDESRLGP